MKKDSMHLYRILKYVQLLVLIISCIALLISVNTNPLFNIDVLTNFGLMGLCILLCVFMLFSFVCIIVDFRQLKKSLSDNDDLNRLAYLDTLTGIPNRISCDIMFQHYENAESSVILNLGSSLISITNLSLINEALGREKGNFLIQDFAMLFDRVGSKYGFVGRNGGNEFLIVIEDCTKEKMQHFLEDLSNEVKDYNEKSNHMPVTYKSNSVYNSELNKTVFADIIAQLYKERGQA